MGTSLSEPRGRLRGALAALLTLLALAAATSGLTLLIRADRSRQTAAALLDLARAVELPAGSTPLSFGCPTSQYVQCGQLTLDVDQVAEQMRAMLSVIAEEEAKLSCSTLPSRQPGELRNCLIRIDRGGHAILITVNPVPHLVDGHAVLSGAEVRIQTA